MPTVDPNHNGSRGVVKSTARNAIPTTNMEVDDPVFVEENGLSGTPLSTSMVVGGRVYHVYQSIIYPSTSAQRHQVFRDEALIYVAGTERNWRKAKRCTALSSYVADWSHKGGQSDGFQCGSLKRVSGGRLLTD